MAPTPTTRKARGPASKKRDRSNDKALLVAISYAHPVREGVAPLNMTHSDLDRLATNLVDHWGYHPQNITKMKDGDSDARMRPTRDNILREINNLVEGVKAGDRRVFYFAGHCYQIVNHRGTEHDNLDEVILTDDHHGPPDMYTDKDGKKQYFNFGLLPPGDEKHDIRQGIIIDNEFREHLVNKIPVGARLVAISDTCHSGTLFDLDYHWLGVGSRMKTWSRLRGRKSQAKRKTTSGTVRRSEKITFSREATVIAPNRGEPPSRKNSKPVDPDAPWLQEEQKRCMSPELEELEVTTISSSQDDQLTWSSSTDTMTKHLLQIIEDLRDTHITYRELTKRLNDKMGKARLRMLQASLRKESEDKAKKLRAKAKRVQQPVIGAMSRRTPSKVFEL